jgi:hypothetical protein
MNLFHNLFLVFINVMEHVRVNGNDCIFNPHWQHVQHLHVHALLFFVFGKFVEGNGDCHLDGTDFEETQVQLVGLLFGFGWRVAVGHGFRADDGQLGLFVVKVGDVFDSVSLFLLGLYNSVLGLDFFHLIFEAEKFGNE